MAFGKCPGFDQGKILGWFNPGSTWPARAARCLLHDIADRARARMELWKLGEKLREKNMPVTKQQALVYHSCGPRWENESALLIRAEHNEI